MELEQAFEELKEQVNKSDRKVKTLAEAIVVLTELSLRHDERVDEHRQQLDVFFSLLSELRAVQADTDVKLSALVDAQIHSEDRARRLNVKINDLVDKIDRLTDMVIGHVTNKDAH